VANLRVRAGAMMASPNVIPMADIMLVLLIIFMVVTPLFTPGAPVDMAKVNNPIEMPNAQRDDALIVAISSDGSIFLGSHKMGLDEISSQLSDRTAGRLDKTVFIKSDARAKYGELVKVVDEMRSAGVENVGLLTDKNETSQRDAGLPRSN
jgi:biopolymer transport protein ExbD